MKGCITIVGNDILASLDTTPGDGTRIPLSDETIRQMNDWATRYGRAVYVDDSFQLAPIGTEMFNWLDTGAWASGWASGGGNRLLEITVEDPDSEAAGLLLDLPWEILMSRSVYLAEDPAQPFIVHRRIGPRGDKPVEPAFKDLAVMFMAASPEGEQQLDFEAEESAILSATERLPMHLCVEESGCAEYLRVRMIDEGPFDAVHFSCHGTIHPDKGPILALESPTGKVSPVTPGDLATVLGEEKARLVFLSACRTAELVNGRDGDGR